MILLKDLGCIVDLGCIAPPIKVQGKQSEVVIEQGSLRIQT